MLLYNKYLFFSGLSNLNMFIVVKTFPGLTNMVGDSGTFWLYSAFCFVMILYTLVWIPETKGRSLQVKFIYSEKATKFCEIFPLILTTVHKYSQK